MKKLFDLLTSSKALILAAVGIITLVNELRLNVATYEIKEHNVMMLKNQYDSLRVEMAKIRKEDRDSTKQYINDLSLSNGLIVDYDLITQNTEQAVSKGFKNAISHNEMAINVERAKYDTLYYKTPLGNYYRVIHNKESDTVNEIETVDTLPNGMKSK